MSSSATNKKYADTRASMEPLIEMMQFKGNSEVIPNFWHAAVDYHLLASGEAVGVIGRQPGAGDEGVHGDADVEWVSPK